MFHQITDPVGGSLTFSALCAALPLALLFVLLGVFRVRAPFAALTGLVMAIGSAIILWEMPFGQALSASAAGALYGLVPILWILVSALWIYKLTLATPWFETLGATIRAISDDLRIAAILIGFCFGALLESLAGFGAPVAITAAMLIAAGMNPIKSAVVALLANTAPVAFGSMGTPIIALHGVTGLELDDLSAMAGRQTPFIALVVPLLLVLVVDGKRGVRQTWPVALVAGVVFGVAQFLTSNYFVVELTDVVASVVTVAAVLLMLRFWKPVEIVGISDSAQDSGEARTDEQGAEAGHATRTRIASSKTEARPTPRQILMAVAPYLIVIVVFSIAQIPAVKQWLTSVGSTTFRWPGLHVQDANGKAVAAQTFKLDHLKATGTLMLLSGLITMGLYRISPRRGIRIFADTLSQLRWTIVTVTAVLALSYVMNLSGQTTTLGLALASAGGFFAVLSPVIGWFGVALTGSDTSSNSLFGQLQATAAQETGMSPVLAAAANSAAGVMGKMLSLQNLAVAAAAIGVAGAESTLFRKLLGWSVGLLAFITVIIVLQSTPVLDWMVPA